MHAGNIKGTFYFAFIGHRLAFGKGVAVVEIKDYNVKCSHIKQTIIDDKNIKHLSIAQTCQGAIVIGGGKHSIHLINCLLNSNKPVVAIKHTHGIVANDLPKGCEVKSNLLTAILWLHHKIENRK
ncbi:MAG: hypothetical protein MJK12_13410 [Colwellia sp.]|nr:hypothetical protein [Colwellia sp.]